MDYGYNGYPLVAQTLRTPFKDSLVCFLLLACVACLVFGFCPSTCRVPHRVLRRDPSFGCTMSLGTEEGGMMQGSHGINIHI